MTEVMWGEQVWEQFGGWLDRQAPTAVFVLTDSNTREKCLPFLQDCLPRPLIPITVPAGELSKTLDSATHIWGALYQAAADRQTLLLNLGGGMITDLGGFAAATFKRGIPFVHVPTSLLAMVDAAIGGKTGLDFQEGKNILGSFAQPACVVVDPTFLHTLPTEEWRSGFAEMLKHGLLADGDLFRELAALPKPEAVTPSLIHRAIAIKSAIVEQDPLEKGIRRSLNLGHTIGHALESAALRAGLLLRHGDAVAAGLIAEGWLAQEKGFLSTSEAAAIEVVVRRFFPPIPVQVLDEAVLRGFLRQDKKNAAGQVRMALPTAIGATTLDVAVSEEEAMMAIRQYARGGRG